MKNTISSRAKIVKKGIINSIKNNTMTKEKFGHFAQGKTVKIFVEIQNIYFYTSIITEKIFLLIGFAII